VPRSFAILLLLIPLLNASPAAAQIVNIQPLLGPATADGFSLELTGSAELKTGNVDLFVGKGGLLMSYFAGDHRIISASSGELGIKNDAEYMNALFSHLRYQVYFTEAFAWECWIQGASNKFKRLSFRGLAGTGPRLELFRGEGFNLAIGLHYMFEVEELRRDDDPEESLAETNHRSNTYLSFSWDLLEQLTLTETVYFQPKLNAPADDFRLANEVRLVAKVHKNFGLGANFVVAYDQEPPPQVEGLDTSLLATITISL
jgi:hypothetical protein